MEDQKSPTSPDNMMDQQGTRTAPYYSIPARHVVSVEHPAIVKNVDKAIETLQGNAGISKILNPPKADTRAKLFLRPEDAMSRPLQSTSSASNNILLRVTVPKRTGRKRKKGSDEPFSGVPVTTVHEQPQRRSAKQLLRSLSDNVGKYKVEPVGMVNRTHVFRGMPDFVYSTTGSAFTNRFREQILSFDYDKMKQFDIDMSKGATSNVDIIPPPSLSHGDVPFTYIYRQNPTVRQSVDTSGNLTTVNTSQAAKVHTYLLPFDAPVPTKPRENLAPINTLEPTLRETIALVEDLFKDRPAWTRRGLRNHLKTPEQRYALRHAVPYVGYIFRSGPWRDAIIKFGHDPRTSPDYRIYQTVMFRILSGTSELARDAGSGHTHLFTGTPPLPPDGRMWMFCDITDPLLRSILFPDPPPPGFLRETCEIAVDGWFGSGTIGKARTIMRAKVQSMLDGRAADEREFARVLRFPDHVAPDSSLADFTLDPEGTSSREMQLATDIRASIKASWKGQLDAAGASARTNGSAPSAAGVASDAARAKRVQWSEDVGEEEESEGEGEEEALEEAERLEAQVAAAAEAVEAAATAADEANDLDQEESDEGEDMDVDEPSKS
ncbi:transcription factor TFIIIC subunit TFC1 [Aspergillus novofumigatus IBT 16806]|uniref:Putative RNA polymerase III transcription factor subunit n=1 Tax=Aspergillus novofumigatus (strain IBT 16806) TaxID=1392255 RepID=A0A2I1CFZ0_ASPN1|nr:putative RNA polymerase III transcription factor subunit [Aspergillus novofumigatus IBT 16806]PKX96545.1 putative RNA polymerase III transcription factor subunit [Aspergillus novofumigatus IBT 16806]